MATNFTGVPKDQVGPKWDIALGYFDPNLVANGITGAVNMMGYCIPPSGNYQEGTDTTDDAHMVQISSPNSTDRSARFPQASQGDWSKGERQRVFDNPAMYYTSDGNVDVSTPGNLTLLPGVLQTTITLNGQFNTVPLATDGGAWYAGIKSGANNFAEGTGGAPVLSGTVCNGHEIFDLLYTPFALVGLTDEGLWVIVAGAPPTSSQLVAEAQSNPEIPTRSMAYLNDVIYYINDSAAGTSFVKTYTRGTNATATALTATASERFFQCICSSASGIVLATTSKLPFQNFLYTWSGSTGDTIQRIAEFQGRVEYMVEALGTVYVLVRQFQVPYLSHPAWTLYAVVGSQVSLVDDSRWITDPTFQPNCVSVNTYDANNMSRTADFKPMMTTDGRFLYISWPGLATRRIDLINGGISQIGANTSAAQSAVSARRFITADIAQFVDISAYGSTCVVSQYMQAATSGSLTSSFMDFDSPGTGKIFRSIEFQTSAPLTGTQAVAFAYRLNQQDAFTNLTTIPIGPRNFSVPFPSDIKGTEVQVRVTLTADPAAGAPTVSGISVIYDLGRIFNVVVGCRRNQQGRTQFGTVDGSPNTAQQLQANLQNIRNVGGGRGYAYIPDPTQTDGVGVIQIRLNDYQRQTPNGMAPGLIPGEDSVPDMEADYLVQLVESFDPQ